MYVFVFQTLENNSLSWETRFKGFLICFVLGIILSVFGTLALFLHKGLALFALFYTLGNITSMLRCGTVIWGTDILKYYFLAYIVLNFSQHMFPNGTDEST